MSPKILNVTFGREALSVSETTWREALEKAEIDQAVGIRHAVIDGGRESWRIHVAEIFNKVGNHFHKKDAEVYKIVQGRGTLHYGPVLSYEGAESPDTVVDYQSPLDVSEGNAFSIPEGYAHQLENAGDTPLIILFACPDSHLNDDQDRYHLADAVTLRPSQNLAL